MTESHPEYFRYSTLVLAWRLFLLMFVIDTLFALAFIIYGALNPPVIFHIPFILTLWLLHTIKFVFLAYAVIKVVAYWEERRSYISGHQLITRRGILNKKEQIYDLGQLKSVYRRQSWLGKRLNYGNVICLFTASGYSEELHLDNLRDALYYEQRLAQFLGHE